MYPPLDTHNIILITLLINTVHFHTRALPTKLNPNKLKMPIFIHFTDILLTLFSVTPIKQNKTQQTVRSGIRVLMVLLIKAICNLS